MVAKDLTLTVEMTPDDVKEACREWAHARIAAAVTMSTYRDTTFIVTMTGDDRMGPGYYELTSAKVVFSIGR